jgi:hypothetical protein
VTDGFVGVELRQPPSVQVQWRSEVLALHGRFSAFLVTAPDCFHFVLLGIPPL